MDSTTQRMISVWYFSRVGPWFQCVRTLPAPLHTNISPPDTPSPDFPSAAPQTILSWTCECGSGRHWLDLSSEKLPNRE